MSGSQVCLGKGLARAGDCPGCRKKSEGQIVSGSRVRLVGRVGSQQGAGVGPGHRINSVGIDIFHQRVGLGVAL